MERRFAFRSAVTHKTAGLNARKGGAIGVCAIIEKHSRAKKATGTRRCAERGMQRCFSSFRVSIVRVCAMLQQKCAQLPMSMKRGSDETKVLAQRLKFFAMIQLNNELR